MREATSRKSIGLVLALFAAALVLAACGAAATQAGDTGASATPTAVSPVPLEDLLVYVPAGHFYMGSDPKIDPLAQPDEEPSHSVLLDGFFIFRDEISNGFYKQCVADGKCTDPTIFEDGPSTHYNDPEFVEYPVVGVNWDQANAFCTWVDSRLPTEAEWEKTARGEFGDIYPWGDTTPDCSLANLAGCFTQPPDTEKIGQLPDGQSAYEANDMSGNVAEWTSDWFDPNYYQISPGIAPQGPDQGELRVVRGGSYQDGPDAVRTAERLGLDPKMAYNNVGFRCVPIGEMQTPVQAPFCQPNYVPFCVDPNRDPNDCGQLPTGQVTPTLPEGYNFVAFGCPNSDGIVDVTIDVTGGSLPGDTITVGGNTFTCVESPTTPGRYICKGPHPPQGTLTTIKVCPNDQQTGAVSDGLVAYQAPAPSISLVAYQPEQAAGNQLVAFSPSQDNQPGLQAYQPAQLQGLQAFTPPSAGALVAYNSVANYTCPDGYVVNPDTGQCELNPDGACPDGWTYDMQTYSCVPSDGSCPEGTTYYEYTHSCVPDTEGTCPDGYSFDEANNSCDPQGNNDGGGACPLGYYFDTAINCCAPQTGDNGGCDAGSYFSVAANQCMPVDQNGCQEGYKYDPYEGGCVPDNGNGPTTDAGCRLEGYVMNDQGQCVPGGSDGNNQSDGNAGGCPTDSYYDANLEQCIQLTDGQCGPGYRYDQLTEACIPTDGPGSGCPNGYAYSDSLNCCAPLPGTDGSACPGGQPNAGGPNLETFAAAPSTTGFDNGYGYCDPTGGNQCPGGYTYDGELQTCVPSNTDGTTVGACPDGTYYDEGLGYCVQTSCGCQLGTYYDEQTQTCIPYGGETGQNGCWTYTVSVPECPIATATTDPRCDKGERFNNETGRCEPI